MTEISRHRPHFRQDVQSDRGKNNQRFIECRSILLDNVRAGGNDRAVAVGHQEITMGNEGGRHIRPDENINSIMILPQLLDLHSAKIPRDTEGIHDKMTDGVVLLLLFFLIFSASAPLILLVRQHRFLISQIGKINRVFWEGRYPKVSFINPFM